MYFIFVYINYFNYQQIKSDETASLTTKIEFAFLNSFLSDDVQNYSIFKMSTYQ